MGQERRENVRWADLLHTAGEPRWAAVVDGLLAATVVLWILLLSLVDPGPTSRFVVPLVLVVGVVWRVFLLVESSDRSHAPGLEDASATEAHEPDQAAHGSAQAA
jgi:hypothetical protein